MRKRTVRHQGQIMITMLYVMVVGLIITTGAALAVIANTQAATAYEMSALAHSAAESGLENAVLRLIRNPSYIGETLTIDADRTAVVTVSTGSGITITSVGTFRNITRRMEAGIQYNGGILSIDRWSEVP